MVFRGLAQPLQRRGSRHPCWHGIKDPHPLQQVTIGHCCLFGGFLLVPWGGSLKNGRVRRGCSGGSPICRQPLSQNRRTADAAPGFINVMVDNTIDVTVQQISPHRLIHAPDSRETRGDDLIGIVRGGHFSAPLNIRVRSRKQFRQRNSWRLKPTFRQRHGPHHDTHDSSRPGVNPCSRNGSRRSSQYESSRSSTIVHSMAHHIPHVGHQLPFIDEYSPLTRKNDLRILSDNRPCLTSVQREHVVASLGCCGGFSHSFRTFQCDGGQ